MAWTDDDHQTHKQMIVGGKTSSCVGKSDSEKILGSQYVENGMHVGAPDKFGLMEGTVMINKSSEQQGPFALEVQDDEHIRDNLWVEQETKTKTLVADKIDVRKAFITTINKGSCNFVIDGKLKNGDTITLPEEWEWLVHQDTITVNLTPIGAPQILFVRGQQGTTIKVGSHSALPINCYYTVYGERADTPREPNVFPAEDLLTDKFVGQ